MKTASTRALFTYWDGLRGQRTAPERGEIEPGAIRHALLDTFILETSSDGPNFRLAGTRLCALFGGELKDRTITSLVAGMAPRVELARLIEAVMDESAGAVAGLSIGAESGSAADFELLVLPLRHRGKTHARVLGALSPVSACPWLGLLPVKSVDIRSMRFIWASGRSDTPVVRPVVRGQLQVIEGGKR